MRKLFTILLCSLLFILPSTSYVHASNPTDEITNYTIDISVNEDATLNIIYHIDWLVLDDEELGPLSWVKIGVPNSEYISYNAISSNITDMTDDGQYAYIYFDRDYYAGETVSFEYEIVQDYMYDIGTEQATYHFTPGWFDEIAVDELTINWYDTNYNSFSTWGVAYDDHIEFTTSLEAGEKASIEIYYPNTQYAFSSNKHYAQSNQTDYYDDYNYSYNYYDNYYDDSGGDTSDAGLGVMLVVFLLVSLYARMRNIIGYEDEANMDPEVPTIERVIVTYYDICPKCHTPAKDDEKICSVCGESLIKDTKTVVEKDVAAYENMETYRTTGTYYYIGHPHTYVNVKVIPPKPHHRGGGHTGHHGGGHVGGCACACASCACACACACAGGGRAGCTNKDFYNTNLKLEQIEKKSKYKMIKTKRD